VIALLLAWALLPDPDEELTSAVERVPLTVRVPDPVVTKAKQEVPTKSRAREPELVTLTLTNRPDWAVVFLDDDRIRESSVDLRPSREARRLEVKRGNRRVYSERITIERDKEIDVGELVGRTEEARAKSRPSKTAQAKSQTTKAGGDGGAPPPPQKRERYPFRKDHPGAILSGTQREE
jgi:hypothetical protein